MPGILETRSTTITLLTGVLGLGAVVAFLGGMAQLALARGAPFDLAGRSEAIAILLFLVAAALGVAAWGIYAQQPWSHALGLLAAGVAALVGVFGLYLGDITVSLLLLLLAGVAFALLLRPETRTWAAEGRREPVGDLPGTRPGTGLP